jgi:exodeoxyribonuclease V alpha subunit
MIELWESDDPTDPRRALTATGLLRTFNEAGVLEAADVHLGSRLAAIVGESDPRVQLAVALANRAVRAGSVCIDLRSVTEVAPELPWPAYAEWLAAVRASPLVEQGVVWVEFDLVYLDRYRRQEAQVWDDLSDRAARAAPALDQALLQASLDRLFPDSEGTGADYTEQRAACATAAGRWTTVLTGGPGTGKTTTVARLLAILAEQLEAGGGTARIAITAPTGKAAARLQEQVLASSADFDATDLARLHGIQATTLHRLLGFRHDNSTRFRHSRANRLPFDVIVVDETSMVSLTMMARLLEAVRPDARLVLVGDPDQLASVEAGAVLNDIVAGYAERRDSPVVSLTKVHRFGPHIGELAAALREGDADRVVEVLSAGHDEVVWLTDDDRASLVRETSLPAALAVRQLAWAGDSEGALAALDGHRLLCAHRESVRHWNQQVEHWLAETTGDPLYEPMYVGRPLLVTANDYGLGIYNGDTGVVVRAGDDHRRAVISGAAGALDFAPTRLSDVETMHAMTIHKSQGGQAEVVTVLLPAADSRLLTCELFYTAVTRASRRVRVIGSEAEVRAAVGRRAQRASGLQRRISG